MNMMHTLPATWRWARLGDVCVPTETRDPRHELDAAFKYVDITSVDNTRKKIIDAREILGKDAPSRARQVIRAGDVIVSTTRPNLNAVALISQDLDNQICSTGFCVLRPTQELDSSFLFAFVQTAKFVDELSEQVKGALYPAVTDAQVRAVEMPLPPLLEQRRISTRLNAVMAEIARARAAALDALDAAKTLPAALLRAVFESDEIRKWKTVKIGDVCNRRQDIVHPKDGTKGELRFVGLEHVESNTGRRLGELILDAEELDGRKPRFFTGDVLYGYLRPYLNKVWVAEFDGVSSVDQYAFRMDKDRAIPQYIAQYMRSPVYLNLAPVGFTPGFLPRIRSEEVESVPIPLPPLVEQQRISTKIDNSLEVAQQVRASAQSQLDAINALPAAYLRKAFRGDL
jgi:type I restriction enzyme, S subunit